MSAMKFVTSTLFATLLATASSAATVTIDFDNLEGDVAVGDAYADLGVVFENALTFDRSNTDNAVSFPNAVTSIATPGRTAMNAPIVALFANGVSSVSLRALEVGGGGVSVRAFDALEGGQLVDEFRRFGFGAGRNGVINANVTGDAIFRVEFSKADNRVDPDSDFSIYDDLSFQTLEVAPVPLPASLPLLFGALGSVAVMRRRRARG